MITRSVVSAFSSVAGSATERESSAHWFNSDLVKSQNVCGSTVYDNRLLKGTARAVQPGRAYSFDGVDDHITVADGSALDFQDTNFTFSCWLYIDSTGTSTVGRLLSKSVASASGWDVMINHTSATSNVIFRTNTAGATQNSNATFLRDQWIHVAIVRSGTSASFYQNGILLTPVASATHTGVVSNTGTTYLGRTQGSATAYFKGKVHSLAIHSGALTLADIQAQYAGTYNATNMKLFLRMDDGSGTTAFTSCGNSYHGNLVNGTSHTTLTDGNGADYQNKVGYSNYLTLNGTSQYITTTYTTNPSTTFRVIAYANPTNYTTARFIVSKGTVAEKGFGVYFSVTNGYLVLTVSPDNINNRTWTTTNTFTAGVDYKVDLTWTIATGAVTLYVNDVLQTGAWNVMPTALNATTRAYEIGRQNESTNYFIGRIYGVKIYHDSTLQANYPISEGSGTSILDISGNSRHGTAVGTPEWIKSPRNENNKTKDVFGNTLQYTGSVPYNANLVQSNCLTFNGTTQYISLPNIAGWQELVVGWEFECYLSVANYTVGRTIYSQYKNTINHQLVKMVRVDVTTGILAVFIASSTGGYNTWSTGYVVPTNTAVKIRVVVNTNRTAYLYVNDVLYGGSSFANYSTTPDLTVKSNIGNTDGVGTLFSGSIWGVKLTNIVTGVKAYYPISCGSGSTIYDVSGSGSHGTAINAPTWTTQDVFHWNIENGFRLSGAVRIPAKSDGTAAADGNAITNPTANGHNGAETKINFNPNGSPKLANASAPTAYTYGSALPARFTKSYSGGVEYDFRFI